jgi:hypothetical protein
VPPNDAALDQALAQLMGNAPETGPPQKLEPPPQGSETPPEGSTPPPESADAVDPTPEEIPPPSSLKDLAAKAGLEVKQLYDMELPGLEGMTLGQVKDRAKELRDVDASREAVETERAGIRQERLRWTQELRAAQQAGLREYSDAERLQIGQLLQRHADAEATQIMNAVPEWANQATLKADFEGMAGLLKPYGYSPTDVAQALEGDARFALFMKNQLDRDRRLKAAEAKVKTPPKKLQAPSGLTPKRTDALNGVINNPRASAIDRGLAALIQGTLK